MKYDFTAIEQKWQKVWDEQKAFECEIDRSKKKFYGLIEFPYPSGAGLHVGHPRPYTAMDIIARWYVIPLSTLATPTDTGFSLKEMNLVNQDDQWDAANKERLLERWNKEITAAPAK